MNVPTGGRASFEVDDAAAEGLACAVGQQGLAGPFNFSTGPTGDGRGGGDWNVFYFSDSDDTQLFLLFLSDYSKCERVSQDDTPRCCLREATG